MNHFIKVIYETTTKDSRGLYVKAIKDGLVPFLDKEYIVSSSYKENMETLVQDLMSNGMAILSTGELIPVFRIYSFEPYENNQINQKKNDRPQIKDEKVEVKRFKHKRRFHNKHFKNINEKDSGKPQENASSNASNSNGTNTTPTV